jgi:hypothetical protein
MSQLVANGVDLRQLVGESMDSEHLGEPGAEV